jgi:hypothetical protein
MIICTLSFLVGMTATPLPRPAHSPLHPPVSRRAPKRSSSALRLPRVSASDLYAARVRRRLASYLRMRLLELRKAGLDRAAGVVERNLPLDKLFEH